MPYQLVLSLRYYRNGGRNRSPRNDALQTPSGPEGSSGSRSSRVPRKGGFRVATPFETSVPQRSVVQVILAIVLLRPSKGYEMVSRKIYGLVIALALLCSAAYFLTNSPEHFKATGTKQELAIVSGKGTASSLKNPNPAASEVDAQTSAADHQTGDTETKLFSASSRPAHTVTDFIGEAGCRMLIRSPRAQSMVLMSVPTSTGSRFVLLDDERIVAEGQLPFIPRRMSLGFPEFASPLIAFSVPSVDTEVRHQLRVFRGSGEIFSAESVWDYGLAKDGSSYFVVEPVSVDSTRLRLRNFKQGSEKHFDLDQMYAADSEGQPPYHAAYSHGETEIQFTPSAQDLNRRYAFFPVGSGERRRVMVELQSKNSQVLFASSNMLYMATITQDRMYAEIIKYSAPVGAPWKLAEEWTTRLQASAYTGRLSLAEQGELLVVHGDAEPSILRTSNGELITAISLWNEEIRQIVGEQAFEGFLEQVRETGVLPELGIVQRDSMVHGNAFIGILEPTDEPGPAVNPSATVMKLSKVLDSGELGDTNQRLEIPAHGIPTPCRLADPVFAGVSTAASEIPYAMR